MIAFQATFDSILLFIMTLVIILRYITDVFLFNVYKCFFCFCHFFMFVNVLYFNMNVFCIYGLILADQLDLIS